MCASITADWLSKIQLDAIGTISKCMAISPEAPGRDLHTSDEDDITSSDI